MHKVLAPQTCLQGIYGSLSLSYLKVSLLVGIMSKWGCLKYTLHLKQRT